MKSVYLSEKVFKKISDGKNVVNYHNKYVKTIDDVDYYIMTDGVAIEVNQLSEEEKKYYCRVNTSEDVMMLELNNEGFKTLGWFPTKLVAGVIPTDVGGGIIRDRFSMNTPLSIKTGWLEKNGCAGSFTGLFLKSKVNEAIKILRENGFKVIEK